ncbi:LADA_0D00914g1_1 [Lachancea dasiensis]|uniref:LADA_0D00914g1_1 n=1 Tax=Lachancea dasiensis TaxID=1072105 RepID=A0A1G4J3W3_9SACH|nr:LADA_0D00914g1_1 [Lachancea dasiensis]
MADERRETERSAESAPSRESESRKFIAPGRSILKQRLSQEDDQSGNLTISSIPVNSQELQDPLGENNTTSRISTSKMHSKTDRRVSFAPDVTLHRVDFVLQQPQSFREPRRKWTPKRIPPSDNPVPEDTMEITRVVGGESGNDVSTMGHESTQPYKPVFDKEVSMEITQLFSKYSAKPAPALEGVDGQEDMDTTRPLSVEPNNIDVSSNKLEQEMELTEPHDVALKRGGSRLLGGKKGQSDDGDGSLSFEKFDHDLSDMETTEPVHVPYRKTTNSLREDSQRIESQEEPFIFGHPKHSQQDREITDIRSSQVVTSTQKQAERQSQLTAPTATGNDRLHSQTLFKRRKVQAKENEPHSSSSNSSVVEDEMELTMMEKLSPIAVHVDQEDNSKAAEAELANQRTHDTQSIDKGSSSQTSAENGITLRTFLDAVGISTLSNDVSKDISKLEFNHLPEGAHLSASGTYNTLYANMPILEIYAFCCKELLQRIAKSKQVFKAVEEQVAASPPPAIFHKYLSATPEDREAMKNQIELIRRYSQLQAAKVWYEWRSRHLKGIQNVLQENLMILRDELETLSARIDNITGINKRVNEIKLNLSREIHLYRESSKFKNVHSKIPDRLKIEKLRVDLAGEVENLNECTHLISRAKSLKKEIEELQSKANKTQKQISILSSEVKKKAHFAIREVPKLQSTFHQLQLISGVLLKGYTGTKLNVQLCGSYITLEFDVKRLAMIDESVVSFPKSIDSFSREIYERTVHSARHSSQDAGHFVRAILQSNETLQYLQDEYRRLQLVFPCHVMKSGGGLVIELTFFDFLTRNNVLLHLSLSEFISAAKGELNKTPKLQLKSLKVESYSLKDLMLRFRIKASAVLPWLKDAVLY